MTEQEKIQLRYNYVMEKTKNAHGDFARTGGGASNQMRMFQENLKELGATFGQYILPYFTKAVKKLKRGSIVKNIGTCIFALGIVTPGIMLIKRLFAKDDQEFQTKKEIREQLIKEGIIA